MSGNTFIKDHVDLRSTNSQSVEELQEIQNESKAQNLPNQENIFGTASLRKYHKSANNLPDPTNPPLGFDKNNAFDNIFPFVRVPYLQPKTNEDVISFGIQENAYLDPRTKKLSLNAVFFGDNLHVLRAIPSNSVDLIYIDPPFFSGREYNQIWGEDNEIRTFNDIWEDGLPSYLIWLNARLWEMRRILKSSGSIYVHCDWHASHYIKSEMDKIFGYENFRSEIIWKRSDSHNDSKTYSFVDDRIFFYSKTDEFIFNTQYSPMSQEVIEAWYYKIDEKGRRYKLSDTTAPGGRGPVYNWKGITKAWRYTYENMVKLEKEGRLYHTKTGYPKKIVYLEESKGVPLNSIWTDIRGINRTAKELLGYPTQKPEALLERIIKTSSNEGDIIADFFMGGGTTCAVSMKLKRKFIGCDISRVAASVTLDRLVEVGEEMTMQKSSFTIAKEEQQALIKPSHQQIGLLQYDVIPSIHLYYVGIYPTEKFINIEQKTFNEFILTCYGARIWTSEGAITGVMNAATTILVGSHNPKEILNPDTIRQFVFDSLKQRFSEGIRMKLKIIAWSFPRPIQKYCQQIEKYLEKQGVNIALELIPINSEQFRHRITEQYAGKSITDSDFLLKFIVSPTIGDIAIKKVNDLQYQFIAEGAHSNNLDGSLINCQWDFDYKNGRFSDKEYALMREKVNDEKRKGMYQAVLVATKQFEKPGKYIVACRVQDNFGAETMIKKEIEIS